MREILFKGKRFSNGEWVIGGIMKTFHPNYDCENEEEFLSQSPNCYCICANNKDYFVEQASIGQYTGSTDNNGTKIFEGDIGRYKQTDRAKINDKPITCIGKVVYNEKTASFAVDSKDEIGAKNYDYFPIKDFEIIGNIHDNPELLRTPQNDEVRE